jgi:hypothetical protein
MARQYTKEELANIPKTPYSALGDWLSNIFSPAGYNPVAMSSTGVPRQKGALPPMGRTQNTAQQSPSPYAGAFTGGFEDLSESMLGGISPAAAYADIFPTQQVPYFDAGETKIDSSVPLSATNANNRAQQGGKDSQALQDAYESVMKSQQNAAAMGFGSIDKAGKYTENQQGGVNQIGGSQSLAQIGFKPDPRRAYSTEKDSAGNIIAITPLSLKGEDPLVTAAAKGWKAPGSEGGAGSPFTPNLDKFKARQAEGALTPSWEKKPVNFGQEGVDRQSERAAAGLTAGKTPEQIAQNRAILQSMADTRKAGGGQSIGKVIGTTPTSSDVASSGSVSQFTGMEGEAPFKGAKLSSSDQKKWDKATQAGVEEIKKKYKEGNA